MPNMSRLLLPEGPQPFETFGHVVRARREKIGVSQERLAQLCGLDRTYVSGIERGRRNPTLQAVFRLAVGLRQSPADLLGSTVRLLGEDSGWYAQALERGSIDT